MDDMTPAEDAPLHSLAWFREKVAAGLDAQFGIRDGGAFSDALAGYLAAQSARRRAAPPPAGSGEREALAPLQNAAEGMVDAAARLEDFEQLPAAQLLRAHAAAVRLHRCTPPPAGSGVAEKLTAAILDIDAHATPLGEDADGFVSGGYLVTTGALHRALGVIGRSAPMCATCGPDHRCQPAGAPAGSGVTVDRDALASAMYHALEEAVRARGVTPGHVYADIEAVAAVALAEIERQRGEQR